MLLSLDFSFIWEKCKYLRALQQPFLTTINQNIHIRIHIRIKYFLLKYLNKRFQTVQATHSHGIAYNQIIESPTDQAAV